MSKPHRYIFRKQGANVSLVAISQKRLNKAKQHEIVNAYLSNRNEGEFVTGKGRIVIYNDAKKATSLE